MQSLALLIGVALVTGCDDFPERSADLACEDDNDCDDGRRCDRGYCVVGPAVTCDNPLPCATPSMVTVCGGACWASCMEKVTGPAAQDRCVAWDPLARAAPLRTSDDAACFGMVQLAGEDMWIGLVQDPGAGRPDVRWSWNADARPLDYTAWDEIGVEPDDRDLQENGDEQCALTNADDLWSDQACDEMHYFACRR